MIAFGCTVSEAEPYRRYAEPGILLAAEADSKVYPFAAVGTIGRGYNLLLDTAGAEPELEALVLVHPHSEIADPDLCAKIRDAFADPDVAVLGCSGATGVSSIAWWEGRVSSGHVEHRYSESGGGSMTAYGWTNPVPPPVDVETVDGFMLILSPWAVRNIRFDEGLIFGHGFDLDYCLQVREAGRRVRTIDAHLIQHRSLDLIGDMDLWVEAHVAIGRKWDQQLLLDRNGDQVKDWKQRARRAEAEREASRAVAYSRRLSFDARLADVQSTIEEAMATLSWRATAPLREVNLWRRTRSARRHAARTDA